MQYNAGQAGGRSGETSDGLVTLCSVPGQHHNAGQAGGRSGETSDGLVTLCSVP